MGIFDNNSEKLKYLDDERLKIWERLSDLEKTVEKKTSDYEKEAKQSSKKTSEFRNKSEDAKNKALEILDEIEKISNRINEFKEELSTIFSESLNSYENLKSYEEETKKSLNSIVEKTARLQEIYDDHDDLVEKVTELEEIFDSSHDKHSKTEALYANITSRKKEIDQLYYEIIGYTETDEETGDENYVSGLKGELEEVYSELSDDSNNLRNKIIDIEKNSNDKFNLFIGNCSAKYEKIQDRIEGLLPNALTAGLSYAYSEKRDKESIEKESSTKKFDKSIIALTLISLIPFFISILSMYGGKSFEQSLLDMPRLVLCILPLYIPALWVAYSSNKKVNLSKRLIEEYTHKEVLSKTYEGLSRQIQNLDNDDVTINLKTRLLFNILEVSSENPGKLISDYNKADHPLMDALDKSVQLSNAVDRLSNIPGLLKISKILDKRSKDVLQTKAAKVEDGLDSISEDDGIG